MPSIIQNGPETATTSSLLTTRQDFTSTVDTYFIGTATPGTATSAAGWTIKKITFTAGNPTAILVTDTTAVWDDRTTETYS